MGERRVLRGIDSVHTWQCACASAVSSSCAELRAALRAKLKAITEDRRKVVGLLNQAEAHLAAQTKELSEWKAAYGAMEAQYLAGAQANFAGGCPKCEAQAKKIEALRGALAWALGEHPTDEFRPREPGEGAYWWRKELRQRMKPHSVREEG